MPATERRVDSYLLTHFSEDHSTVRARIHLVGPAPDRDNVGRLHFHKQGAAVPDSLADTAGFIHLHFVGSQLQPILDTLRLEKPLFLWWDEQAGVGGLKTRGEPAGEEES